MGKEIANSGIGRRIVSGEGRSIKNEDGVSEKRTRLQLTRMKETA